MSIESRIAAIEKRIKSDKLLFLDMLRDFHQCALEMEITVPDIPEIQTQKELIVDMPYTNHETYILRLSTILYQTKNAMDNSAVWHKLAERYELLDPKKAAAVEAEARSIIDRHSFKNIKKGEDNG